VCQWIGRGDMNKKQKKKLVKKLKEAGKTYTEIGVILADKKKEGGIIDDAKRKAVI
jgi:tryptophan synthase alpha subunit